MAVLAGGVGAIILGLIGLIFWWGDFLRLLAGGIPIALLLGGGLAVYIGIDELKDKLQEKREKESEQKATETEKAKEELEKIKSQAAEYKEELEKLKEKTKE
jgi:hypothetical protein